MRPVLIIGNGESRKSLNLENFRNQFTLVGCNALHRDHRVDHLICCDNRMVKEALANHLSSKTKIYTREMWYKDHRKIGKNKNVHLLPDLPYKGSSRPDQPTHWGSGSYALLLGCLLSDDIHIIGFDLYGSHGKINNIYKGTENYRSYDKPPVDYSYWIYQNQKIFHCYPQKNFFIYNQSSWILPDEWLCKNVHYKKLFDLEPLTLNTESV